MKARPPFPRLACAVAATLGVLGGVTCIAQEMPRAQAPAAREKSAAEVDLTGAHLDKRKFLLGVSMLGKSVARDIEILREITGHTFEPKEEKGSMPDGAKQFRSYALHFKDSSLLINGRYEYRIHPDAGYLPGVSLSFNTKAVCYRVEDLEAVLGRPTRIVSAGEISAKGSGPSYVWNVIYDHAWGVRSIFAFATASCASYVSVRSREAK